MFFNEDTLDMMSDDEVMELLDRSTDELIDTIPDAVNALTLSDDVLITRYTTTYHI